MKYEEFKIVLKKEIDRIYANSSIKVYLDTVDKNNGMVMDAIQFQDTDTSVTPVVYMNELYERYQEYQDMGEIICLVCRTLEAREEIDPKSLIGTWENTRESIEIKMINFEWNREMLQEVPHRRFLDLAAVFQIVLHKSECGTASITVNESILNKWGITEDILWQTAMINLHRAHYTITDMREIMTDTFNMNIEETVENGRMYILSNTEYIHGASGLLRQDLLKGFAEKIQTNFYILPSSLHELILMPETPDICIDELGEMVTWVNETAVKDEDRLSNSAYRYSIVTEEIEMLS